MATYYISPTGNDTTGDGSIGNPWFSFQKAIANTQAGDIAYFRGGVWDMNTIYPNHYPGVSGRGYDGTVGNPVCFFNYPGETPIFDYTNQPIYAGQRGLVLNNVDHAHYKGLTFRNVITSDSEPTEVDGDVIIGCYGVWLSNCTNIIIENCISHGHNGHGFYVSNGSTEILFKNCDSYDNIWPGSVTTSACDGFNVTSDGDVYFSGCRAWNNSDDGYDIPGYGYVAFDHCWAFNNRPGDGNGFKFTTFSPGSQPDLEPLARKYTNCISAYNEAGGFHENEYYAINNLHVFNNIAYKNGFAGFYIPTNGSVYPDNENLYQNNIAYDNGTYDVRAIYNNYTHSYNSWDIVGLTVTDDDFQYIPATDAEGIAILSAARQSDGSLPNLNGFLELAIGSDLIDAGIGVGLPYNGSAPDLGPFRGSTAYYLSPTGNDTTGDGSIGNPWFTLEKAWGSVVAGDTVYMRGGIYEYLQTQTLAGVSGTLGNTIKIYNYPGEVPIIRKHASWVHVGWYYGVFFQSCNYIEFKGVRVTNFRYQQTSPCRGVMAQHVNNSLFENLACYDNELGMMLMGNSGGNLILNCDFYNNYDPYSPIPYGNSDGLDVSSIPNAYNNTVIGCRAWNNGDDGFDFWASEGIVYVEDCWAWSNGYREDGVTVGGDGNGFKLGQVNETTSATRRYLSNCIGALNRVNNFSHNVVEPQVLTCEVYNCFSYGAVSYAGFQFNWGAQAAQNSIFRNNISFNDIYAARLDTWITNDHNSWNTGFLVSSADFVSLNHNQLSSARLSDGSLPPITFGTLVAGSALIDAGVDVGLPFNGVAPDLGAFEYAGLPVVTKHEAIIDYSIPTMPLGVTGIPSWLTVWNDTDSVEVLEGETIMPATTLLLYPNSQNNGSQRKGTIHIKDFIPIENDVALAVKQNGGPTMSTMEVVNAPGENHLIIEAYATSNAYGSNLVTFACTPIHSQYATGVPLTLRIQILRSGMVVYGSTPRYLVMNNRESNGPFSINMTSASVLADNIVILLWTEPLD